MVRWFHNTKTAGVASKYQFILHSEIHIHWSFNLRGASFTPVFSLRGSFYAASRVSTVYDKDKTILRCAIFPFALIDVIYTIFIRVKRIHVERILRVNWETGVLLLKIDQSL